MDDEDLYYVGMGWALEGAVTNTETGKPGEPGEVTVTVYPPKGGSKEFDATAVAGKEDVYAPPIIPLTEAGRWLAVFNSTAPYESCKPRSITVRNPAIGV